MTKEELEDLSDDELRELAQERGKDRKTEQTEREGE